MQVQIYLIRSWTKLLRSPLTKCDSFCCRLKRRRRDCFLLISFFTMVDWLPGVNFINILHWNFLYKIVLWRFSLLQFGFVVFWHKNIGAKAARKMLMKLTTGHTTSCVYSSACVSGGTHSEAEGLQWASGRLCS